MYVANKRFAGDEAEALVPHPWKHQVKVITGASLLEVGEGYAVIQGRNLKLASLAVDSVVTCHIRPNVKFMEEMRAAEIPAANAGDSDIVRNLHHAVLAGATFGKNADAGAVINPNYCPIGDLPLEIQAQLP
jgi:hypothetical protein